MTFILVGIGGGLGAIARFLVIRWASRWFRNFPGGTLLVNLSGSFALGLLLTLVSERLTLPAEMTTLFGTGILGGYTTFSTFSWETLQLIQRGSASQAFLNALLSAGGGLLAALAGIAFGRLF